MSKYEIMLILNPTSDEKVVQEIIKSTFKSKEFELKVLERTELAYEINKSKTAKYVVVNIEATGEEINEFTRKTNINKSIWRIMSINLDTEKGLKRKPKPNKFKKTIGNFRKPYNRDGEKQVNKDNVSDKNIQRKKSNIENKKETNSNLAKETNK